MIDPLMELADRRVLPLDTQAIEDELASLWRQAAESTPGGLLRASSLTLLVPLLEEGLRERVAGVLGQIGAQFACRVILVVQADCEPRARLESHLVAASGGRPPIYWEEVCLEAPRRALQRALSAAGALALPNLPVQVWWPGDADLVGPFFQRVAEVGSRIIVDSGQFTAPLVSLGQYAERVADLRGTIGCVDLNWRRLEPWRMLLAQFFDPPDDRVFLNYLESLAVGYERASGQPPQGYGKALLLVGWLASRLGWSVAAERTGRYQDLEELVFDNGGRWVRADLRRVAVAEARPLGLTAVELRALHGELVGIFTVERSGEQGTAVAQVDDERRELAIRIATHSEAELLRDELASFGRDRIYEDALAVVQALAQKAASSAPSR